MNKKKVKPIGLIPNGSVFCTLRIPPSLEARIPSYRHKFSRSCQTECYYIEIKYLVNNNVVDLYRKEVEPFPLSYGGHL